MNKFEHYTNIINETDSKEELVSLLKNTDFDYNYADDPTQWRKGRDSVSKAKNKTFAMLNQGKEEEVEKIFIDLKLRDYFKYWKQEWEGESKYQQNQIKITKDFEDIKDTIKKDIDSFIKETKDIKIEDNKVIISYTQDRKSNAIREFADKIKQKYKIAKDTNSIEDFIKKEIVKNKSITYQDYKSFHKEQ